MHRILKFILFLALVGLLVSFFAGSITKEGLTIRDILLLTGSVASQINN